MPKSLKGNGQFFFLMADIILIAFSVFSAFLLRFDGQIPDRHIPNMWGLIAVALVFAIPIFYFFKLYSFSWAYVSTSDLVSLAEALTLSFVFIAASLFIFRDQMIFMGFPRSTLFTSFILVFISCGAVRFSKRIYFQLFPKNGGQEKEGALIAGAGDAGEQILRSILNFSESPYLPVGFVDDDPTKQGILIHGFKVLGKIGDIPRLSQTQNLKEGTLIIALPSAGSRTIKEAVETGRKAGFKKIKIVPSLGEIIDGQISIGDLREIQIEDLLGREPVTLNQKSIENFIQDKKVLITGAAGSIGSELSRQVAKFKPSLLLVLDQDETGIFNISKELGEKFPRLNAVSLIADIRDKAKIDQIFNDYRPNIVFHAAAYKHVPLMESHPDEAIKNNVFGMKSVAEAGVKFAAEKFIFISTDKAVKPASVMGATKRIGEMICQNLNGKGKTQFISVRFGNVLNSRGSVIPIFREQIEKGGPVQVTHPEMKRYFMTTPEACLLVMQAGAMGSGGEVFVLDMGKPIKILDLARDIIRLCGYEPDKDIPIVFTEPRPGEKLFEEILTAEEGTISTQNQRIFTAKLSNIDRKKLEEGLNRLEKMSDIENKGKDDIIKTLKELIPTYKPNNK